MLSVIFWRVGVISSTRSRASEAFAAALSADNFSRANDSLRRCSVRISASRAKTSLIPAVNSAGSSSGSAFLFLLTQSSKGLSTRVIKLLFLLLLSLLLLALLLLLLFLLLLLLLLW
jgi:hypothetical protein